MRIAILSYKYHPFPGVGANRWTNFSQQLSSLGQNITVFTANWRKNATKTPKRSWRNIKIVELESNEGRNLSQSNNKYISIIHQLFMRLIRRLAPLKDEASGWNQLVIEEFCAQHNQQKFDVLIATGAPFSTLVAAHKIKCQFPEIFLIQDFRDPFWDISTSYPTKKNCVKLQNILKEATSQADMITTVTESLAKLFKETLSKQNVYCFTNGFNKTEINHTLNSNSKKVYKSKPEVITFVHAGNLTNGRQKSLIDFFKRLSIHIDKEPRYIFEVTNIGYVNQQTEKTLSKISKKILFNSISSIPKKKLLNMLFKYDICLHICAETTPFALSTKIFEYMGLKRPTVSINYGGDIIDLLASYPLGFSINLAKKNNDAMLQELLTFIKSRHKYSGTSEQFSYTNITTRFLNLVLLEITRRNSQSKQGREH